MQLYFFIVALFLIYILFPDWVVFRAMFKVMDKIFMGGGRARW